MSVHIVRIYGTPAAQGSKRALVSRTTGKAMTLDVSREKLRNWRMIVGYTARADLDDSFPVRARPIRVGLSFYLKRPRAHYTNAGALRNKYMGARPSVRPDIDKLTRSTLDALSGVAWGDDSQVVDLTASKYYADPAPEGCVIELVLSEESA